MPYTVCQTPFIIHPAADLLQRHPELRHAGNDLALKYAHHELVTEEQLQAIGVRLWQVLQLDDAFAEARNNAGQQVLPIVIESDDPAVQQLPWEALHHPELGFLGRAEAFTLLRRIPCGSASGLPVQTGPLRVLLFTSLPNDLDPEHARLDVEEEQAQVLEALLPWIAEGKVELEMPDDGRFGSLKQQLHDFQPHVVFLSGHGRLHHQLHTDEPPYGTFLFESEAGASAPIRGDEIASAFIGTPVQCVVLSACESGKSASDALNNGLTRQLARQGLTHVIGMRESVLDRAGILFARHFCDAVAGENRVDMALQLARRAMTGPLKDHTWRDSDATGLSELSLGQ